MSIQVEVATAGEMLCWYRQFRCHQNVDVLSCEFRKMVASMILLANARLPDRRDMLTIDLKFAAKPIIIIPESMDLVEAQCGKRCKSSPEAHRSCHDGRSLTVMTDGWLPARILIVSCFYSIASQWRTDVTATLLISCNMKRFPSFHFLSKAAKYEAGLKVHNWKWMCGMYVFHINQMFIGQ